LKETIQKVNPLKIAYFDCFSGISGDMALGALVDVGVRPDALNVELAKLKLDEFTLYFEKTTKHGIAGTRAIVEITESQSVSSRSKTHHSDSHHHGHTHQPSRCLSDVLTILDNSNLEDRIVTCAKQIFDRLAEAEARVHDMPKDRVHLHEVSGVDSMVDIVGVVIGLHLLGIEEIYASPLLMGSGFVRCAHGLMPVPAPGTLELLRGVPVHQTEIRKELVTPTGAAIVTALGRGFGPMPAMVIDRVGYGAGTRNLEEQPNLLRIVTGEKRSDLEHDQVCLIETNLDDLSPEIMAYVTEKLFEQGALDVFLTPILMKKGRAATKLSVLANVTLQEAMMETLLMETTTFGVRFSAVERFKLSRHFTEVKTRWGVVRVKHGYSGDKLLKSIPEYEDCKRLAEQNHIPLKEIYEEAIRCLHIKDSTNHDN
jgi:uncharacterized protein (TIGR00299 family) protein